MAQARSQTAETPPPFVIAIGSLLILAHLGALVVRVLAAPSGPWPGPEGLTQGPPPAFAQSLHEPTAKGYLNLVRLTHDYRFMGNRPAPPGVTLDVRLKDAKGELLKTIRFPDPKANTWVRHRQELFVQALVPDLPIEPPQGEVVAAPGQQVRTVTIWDAAGEGMLRLREVPEHLVPRNRGVYSPSEWSLVLARSYARYLCRQHGAASAEVVRSTRNPISPMAFLMGGPPPAAFEDLVASYGDVARE